MYVTVAQCIPCQDLAGLTMCITVSGAPEFLRLASSEAYTRTDETGRKQMGPADVEHALQVRTLLFGDPACQAS